jgi:hypothetical protein
VSVNVVGLDHSLDDVWEAVQHWQVSHR